MGILRRLLKLPKRILIDVFLLFVKLLKLFGRLLTVSIKATVIIAVVGAILTVALGGASFIEEYGATNQNEEVGANSEHVETAEEITEEGYGTEEPQSGGGKTGGEGFDSDTETKRIDGATYDAEEIEQELAQRINEYRSQKGRNELRQIGDLRRNARGYSKDMAERGFYSHRNPEGQGVQHRVAMRFPFCDSAGENIHKVPLDKKVRQAATGEVITIDSQSQLSDIIFEDWRASPGHNRNMLNRRWDSSGVGIYVDEDKEWIYATHQFCS
jgi:uncharacterized protein YkwD